MRTKLIALMTAIVAGSAFPAGPELGSLCIAPLLERSDCCGAPDLSCDSEKLSLKIDTKTMPWPIKGSVKIDALDATVQHRVMVLCDGKPQQSFRFRFSEFRSTELCLFLNDLYKTAQLWEVKRCPWWKCK